MLVLTYGVTQKAAKMEDYNLLSTITKTIYKQDKIKKVMNNAQKVDDLFADNNVCVYHFFHENDMESILNHGLLCSKDKCSKATEQKGIYVVWYNDKRVLSTIAETQACAKSDGSVVNDLYLLSINLKHYGISAKDIAPDLNGGGKPDVNSFCCKIMRDIKNIRESDISKWEGGVSDTFGIEFYDLEGYNIEYKPKDFDSLVSYGIYHNIEWKKYE